MNIKEADISIYWWAEKHQEKETGREDCIILKDLLMEQ